MYAVTMDAQHLDAQRRPRKGFGVKGGRNVQRLRLKVGHPSRPWAHRRMGAQLATTGLRSPGEMVALAYDGLQATLEFADGLRLHQTCCYENGSHQSRAPQAIPYRVDGCAQMSEEISSTKRRWASLVVREGRLRQGSVGCWKVGMDAGGLERAGAEQRAKAMVGMDRAKGA